MQGEEFFNIEAVVADDEKENIIKVQQPLNSKKIIKKNDKSYERLADHIGFLPSVIISPYDNNLISDSGEARRRFLDGMISQTDTEYLFILSSTKNDPAKECFTKSFPKESFFDADSLEIYQHHLIKSGNIIHEKERLSTRSSLLSYRSFIS